MVISQMGKYALTFAAGAVTALTGTAVYTRMKEPRPKKVTQSQYERLSPEKQAALNALIQEATSAG